MDAPAEVDLAVAEVHETMHQAPECFGLPRSRWWLDGLRQAVPWRKPRSLPGVWQLLDRFDLAYTRGRRYVHSPDPDYPLKAARLRSIWQQVQADPTPLVLLYQDELTRLALSHRRLCLCLARRGWPACGPRHRL